jgi:hypothetical protein
VEKQIHGPQSMSGAFWGGRSAHWSEFDPQPTGRIQCLAEGGRLFGNLLIYKIELGKQPYRNPNPRFLLLQLIATSAFLPMA